jgi:hypothetical protein
MGEYVVDTRFPPEAPAVARCALCVHIVALPAGHRQTWTGPWSPLPEEKP